MTHRPAVVLAAAFIMGIICQNSFGPMPLLYIVIITLGLLLVAARWQRRCFSIMIMGFIFFLGAFDAWDKGILPLDHISTSLDACKGKEVEAVCRVASVPEVKNKGFAPKKVFECDLERVAGVLRTGRVIVNLYGEGHFAFGDRVRFSGKLSRPYDFSPDASISYRRYLQRQGIYAVLHVRKAASRKLIASASGLTLEGMALGVREDLQNVFRRFLSPGEAGLMNAMLLGPRADISPHVYDIFRKTGTAHIIAISGMNMTLTAIGVVFILAMLNIPRAPRAVLAACIIAFYSLMAGNSAPVARSAIMASVVILSFVMERETDGMNNLALAGLALLALDPGQLQDIGFQLSFLCVASLIILGPLILAPFEDWGLKERPLIWFLVESAAVTLAAFIGSAGILAYDFGYLSLVGLVVNLPVIPLMALVTALGAAVLVVGVVLPALAFPFALCLKVVLNICVGALTAASFVPVIPLGGGVTWLVGAYYAALVTMAGYFYYSHGRPEGTGALIDKPYPL